jgi:hypothetical protein
MTQHLLSLIPFIILIPVIYKMYFSHSGNVETVYVTMPPKNSRKGKIIRASTYAYLLVIALAILFLPQNGSTTSLFDDILIIAIAPLPILSVIYLVYFMFTKKDYRLKLGQPNLARRPISTQRRMSGLLLFGLILLYRFVTIRNEARIHGNYAGTGIGILFTLYLIWLFVKGMRNN